MWWERRERAGCSSCCFFSSKKKIKKYISESRGVFFQPRVDFGHLKSCCVKRKEEEKKKKKALESKFVTQRPESPPRLRSTTPNPFSVQYLDPFSVSSSPACAAPCPLWGARKKRRLGPNLIQNSDSSWPRGRCASGALRLGRRKKKNDVTRSHKGTWDLPNTFQLSRSPAK